MKTVGLLLALFVMPLAALGAQERAVAEEGATISSAHVSGLDLRRLSPSLQQEIGGLAGGALNAERLRELSARIEEEQPRFVAAARALRDPDGAVRVVFVVAYRREKDRQENVNTRYIVEDVEVKGVRQHELSQQLRNDLQALVGKPLDATEADRLEATLLQALPDHEVKRVIVKGSQSGQIRLLFLVNKVESARWLRFEPSKTKWVYHSEQGWGGYTDLSISGRDVRLAPLIAIDNGDDLIEEYSGFGIRFESRKLGTERLGASLEWSTFDQTWRPATLAALEQGAPIPRIYDNRSTVTPLVTFAITRQLWVKTGVSITELEPFDDAPESTMANAAVATIGYDRRWEVGSDETHDLDATFTVRAASETLESDLDYTRYFAQGAYRYRWEKHTVLLAGMVGRLDRDAPLFERFALGDSQTLRGWDKYDIAPAGGDRMFYASAEYRYRGLALFLDSGSVWDRGTDKRVRVSTGVGFHPGPFFMTLGFPLNTDHTTAVFTTGIRFSGFGIEKY
jgi:hypothetical protein